MKTDIIFGIMSVILAKFVRGIKGRLKLMRHHYVVGYRR